MIRMSALRNTPVICCEKRLGLLQDISLDASQKTVRALIVSCGLRGKRMIAREDVLSLCDGFILVRNPQIYKRASEGEHIRFARDTTGILAGYVTDYAIDEKSLHIAAIELICGYSLSQRKNHIWFFTYDRQNEDDCELTIPSCLSPMTD